MFIFGVYKVISSLGLCISVYDIQSIEGGFIFPGDGSSTYKVHVFFFIFDLWSFNCINFESVIKGIIDRQLLQHLAQFYFLDDSHECKVAA